MKLKDIAKINPAIQFVADSMELMSSAGRRAMMSADFTSVPQMLEDEWVRMEQAIRATRTSTVSEKRDDCCCGGSLNTGRAYTDLRHCLMQLHDLQGTLLSLKNHTPLEEVELFELKNLAHLCRQAKVAVKALDMEQALPLHDLTDVFTMLDPDSTGLANFYIYDSYDPRLPSIRRELKALQTSGGEPSRIGELLAEQTDIQRQVCVRLTDSLYAYLRPLTDAMETMAYADFLLAKAELALRWGLTRPALADAMSYTSLFNPRLRQRNAEMGLRYQPVDISLANGVCLVTGANMAGKTVLLKTVGTAQQMVQCGFYAPAEKAHVMLFDDVVSSIGDEQNEMNGLSSYASEIIKISDIVRRSRDCRLLVLIDEPARTTNPVEGKALVQAIVQMLQNASSVSLITTHYGQLGTDCRRLRVRGFVEDMSDLPLNPQNINRFIDYSLTEDQTDEVPQEALRIATILGCDSELLERARAALE